MFIGFGEGRFFFFGFARWFEFFRGCCGWGFSGLFLDFLVLGIGIGRRGFIRFVFILRLFIVFEDFLV